LTIDRADGIECARLDRGKVKCYKLTVSNLQFLALVLTMPRIYRLEAPDSLKDAGIAIIFDEGRPGVKLQWRSGAPLNPADVLATAKDLAAKALAHLIAQDRGSEANSTNWVSVVAACQRHVQDWSDKLKAEVYRASDSEGGGVAGERRLS
jgi:hypothetical protein